MGHVGAHVKVQLQNERLTLLLKSGRTIAEAVSELCAVISTSSCTELPCMIFVKPYHTQLRWNSSGMIEKASVDFVQLPEWPLEVFKPVSRQTAGSVLFSPHVFGIDHLVNEQLLGFDICKDLEVLLVDGLLKFQMKHSQLTVAISHELKLDIQQQLRDKKWLDYAITTWRFCLYCMPDPYAEALWLFNYELLRPVMIADVLPMLAVLDKEKLQYLIVSAGPLSMELPVVRAIYAYTSASVLDIVSIHDIFSVSITNHLYASLDGTVLEELLRFLKSLRRVFALVCEYMSISDPDGQIVDPPAAVAGSLRELLSMSFPYGLAAILDLSQKLNAVGKASSAVFTRQLLSKISIEYVRERSEEVKIGGFNTIFESALLGDSQYLESDLFIDTLIGVSSFDSQQRKLELVGVVGAALGISFYQSSLRNFTAALPGFELILDIFQQHLYPGSHLWLITVCEIIQCFNAIGYGIRAIEVVSQALLTLLKDPFVHHTVHLTPDLKLKCFDFRSMLEADDMDPISSTTTSSCHVCEMKKPVSYCRACARSRCLDCFSAHHSTSTENDSVHIGNTSFKASKRFWKAHKRGEKSEGQTLNNKLLNLNSPWIESNFDILQNLRIIIADSYISRGKYDWAERILQSVLTSSDVDDNNTRHLAALRLSKVMRRQDTLPQDSRYMDVARTMSHCAAETSKKIRSFWLDEVESMMNQSTTLSQGNTMPKLLAEELLKSVSAAARSGSSGHDPYAHEINERLLLIAEQDSFSAATTIDLPDETTVAAAARNDSLDFNELGFIISDMVSPNLLSTPWSARASNAKIQAITTEWRLQDQLKQLNQDLPAESKRGFITNCVERGDVSALLRLIQRGVGLDIKNSVGDSLLHIAVRFGRKEMVRVLLENGAYVSSQDAGSSTPLHIAARYGDDEITELLLQYGADTTSRDIEGLLPVYSACIGGNERAVQLLLSRGLPPNHLPNGKSTMLHLAASYGSDAVATLLIDKGQSIVSRDGDDQTPLHVAAKYGNASTLEILLSNCDLTPLPSDVKLGFYVRVEYESVLEYKDNKGRTALQLAWELVKRNDNVINVLLAHGARDTLVHKFKARINKQLPLELKNDTWAGLKSGYDDLSDNDDELEFKTI